MTDRWRPGPDEFDDELDDEATRLDFLLRNMKDFRVFEDGELVSQHDPDEPIERFDDAVVYLRKDRLPMDPDYLSALDVIARNRDLLRHRLFISVPKGLADNEMHFWREVLAASDSTCDCGHERVITPLIPRTEYVASSEDSVLVTPESDLYLRPAGYPKRSAYTHASIAKYGDGPTGLQLWPDPFSGSENFSFLFEGPPFIPIGQIDAMLRAKGEPLVYTQKDKRGKPIPIFAVSGVNLEYRSVELTLDRDVETFKPGNYKGPNNFQAVILRRRG